MEANGGAAFTDLFKKARWLLLLLLIAAVADDKAACPGPLVLLTAELKLQSMQLC